MNAHPPGLNLKTYAIAQRIVVVPAKIFVGEMWRVMNLGLWSGFSLLLQAGGGF
jgi:hypothetical protein